MSNDARKSAFAVLLRIERSGSYSNIALDAELENSTLTGTDRALASAIVFGVTERLLTIDWYLSRFLSKPLSKLRPEVHTVLRMGLYQIAYMDKIPASAAVNESVKLIRSCGCDFASGLVNAVLRKVASGLPELPDDDSIRFSIPPSTVSILKGSLGDDDARDFLASTFTREPVCIRVNTLKTTASELIELLSSQGVTAENHPLDENALSISFSGSVTHIPAFSDGLFHVQDVSSQLSAKILAPKRGDIVADLCSAPGGKSFTCAQYMENTGTVIACDLYATRLNLVRSGAERLGITCFDIRENDAQKPYKESEFADRVLCDVPCSGLGVISKKPDIRYKDSSEFSTLPDLQYSILVNGSRMLKPGGRLVYSTCTLNNAENTDVCDRFLAESPDFYAVNVADELAIGNTRGNYLTLLPHIHKCDGFFIACFEKVR